jgi:hypothetical protein
MQFNMTRVLCEKLKALTRIAVKKVSSRKYINLFLIPRAIVLSHISHAFFSCALFHFS